MLTKRQIAFIIEEMEKKGISSENLEDILTNDMDTIISLCSEIVSEEGERDGYWGEDGYVEPEDYDDFSPIRLESAAEILTVILESREEEKGL